MTCRQGIAAAVVALLLMGAPVSSGAQQARRLTLRDAVSIATTHHPALITSADREATAAAQADATRLDAVPRVGVVAQLNRLTGNAVPGTTFGMPGVPSVAGPPAPEQSGSTWQSAAGVTAGWDVLELARRPTLIGAADRDVDAARAQTAVARLDVAVRTADVFLTVAEAHALIDSAAATEKRAATFAEVVRTLASQKLRADLDLARAETELGSARVGLERGKLGLQVAAARLANAIGDVSTPTEVVDDPFRAMPPAPSEGTTSGHPAIVAYDAAARAAESRASVARLQYLPRIDLLGSAWLRGGGLVENGGPNSGTADGLAPDAPNWAVGVVATWTPTEIPSARARARVATAEAATLRARSSELGDSLTTDMQVARAASTTSVAIARQSELVVSAARRAREIATTRYQTGIGNVLEVADADRALAAAERDAAVAKIDAWRAFLAFCRAQGDLSPFLSAAGG